MPALLGETVGLTLTLGHPGLVVLCASGGPGAHGNDQAGDSGEYKLWH